MTAERDDWLNLAERSIKDYLRQNDEPIAIEDLVERLTQLQREQRFRSVEVKIAALSLVNKGDAHLNRAWELVLNGQGRHDERAVAA